MTIELMVLGPSILGQILDFLLFDLTELDSSDFNQPLLSKKIANVLEDSDSAVPRIRRLPNGIALANRRLACLALGCTVRKQREMEDLRAQEAWQRSGDLLKRYRRALEEIFLMATDSPFGILIEEREEFTEVFYNSAELQSAYHLRFRGKVLSEMLEGIFQYLSPLVASWTQLDDTNEELQLYFNTVKRYHSSSVVLERIRTVLVNDGREWQCDELNIPSHSMTTPSLDNRTRITSVSIDHGALGLINEERLKSRLASSFGLLTQGRLPHVVCATVVAGAVAYAARELYNLRQQASTLRKQLQEAHNQLGEKESELHQKTEESELLHKKWQGAARMLLSRAVVANEMQETKTSSLSGTEGTSHPRGVASRLVTAATGSGATRVAAAAAMMWLLRLRVSAGGSLQLRGGPHIKAKFGVSRPL